MIDSARVRTPAQILGAKIQTYRMREKIKQQTMASDLEVSPASLSLRESGAVRLTALELIKLIKKYPDLKAIVLADG